METVVKLPENNFSKNSRLSIQTDNNPSNFINLNS